jgi:hypothetical protein
MNRTQRRLTLSRRKAEMDNTEAFDARRQAERERCPERYRLLYEASYLTISSELVAAVAVHEASCERCQVKRAEIAKGASS